MRNSGIAKISNPVLEHPQPGLSLLLTRLSISSCKKIRFFQQYLILATKQNVSVQILRIFFYLLLPNMNQNCVVELGDVYPSIYLQNNVDKLVLSHFVLVNYFDTVWVT